MGSSDVAIGGSGQRNNVIDDSKLKRGAEMMGEITVRRAL
jgi:hypothetical protein